MQPQQLSLLAAPAPPSLAERGVDLRLADVRAMLAELPAGAANLVIADPPWTYDTTSVPEAVLLAGGGRRYVGAEIDPERRDRALALVAQFGVR